MNKATPSVLITLVCLALPPLAHAGPDKCEQAAIASQNIRFQTYTDMAHGMGPDVQQLRALVLLDMNKEKDATLLRCRSAVKKDPKLLKALDCVIGAKDATALASCRGGALLLTGDICAMSVDNTFRLSRDSLKQQFRKKRWDVKAMMAQVNIQLLSKRAETLKICHASVAQDIKDKKPDPEASLRCDVTARSEADLLKCDGKIEKQGALKDP